MLDSIQVGVTGLIGYAKGLRVIGNNTANLNTPGFKALTLQFTDLLKSPSDGTTRGETHAGAGLGTAGTRLDFRAGDLRQTGQDFDFAVEGDGMFVLRDQDGRTSYTRAGQFEWNADGVLVHRLDGSFVQGHRTGAQPGPISLDGLRLSAGKATATARFTGNLSSTLPTHTLSGLKVFDALGEEHLLSVKFTNESSTTPGSWKVEVLDGASSVHSGQLSFTDGKLLADGGKLVFDYGPSGRTPTAVTLDFSREVTSFASGNLATLAMSAQDGHAPGQLTRVSVDAEGHLVTAYSNSQSGKGPRLVLARFTDPQGVRQMGSGRFAAANGHAWHVGAPGEAGFGQVRSGFLEGSNVDLSREFSDLVVMQRGYQASSQVISTANDMLQELFRMKAR